MKQNVKTVNEKITELSARETQTMQRLFKKNTVPGSMDQIADRVNDVLRGRADISEEDRTVSTASMDNGARVDHAIDYLEEMKFINQVLEEHPENSDRNDVM